MVRKGSVRDSVKRVLLIEGTPDLLYHKSERIFTSVEINSKTFHLGSVSEDFVEELKKVNGFKVTQRVSERTYPNSIRLNGIGQRTIVRKVNNNTHIVIGAKDEVELNDRVEKIKSYLEKKGAKITERCGWVCVIDKEKSRQVDYDRAKEEIIYYMRNHNEYSIKTVSDYLMIDKSLVEKILFELGYKMKSKFVPISKQEKTKKLRDMVIQMGIGAESLNEIGKK